MLMRVIHSKSDDAYDNANEIVNKVFESLL